MIKAYLVGIPSMYEGEDIEVRYSLFQDGLNINKESIYLGYVKPVLVGEVSLLTLLRKIEKYKKEEITIVINNSQLYETIKGANTTKDGEVIKLSNNIRKQLEKFHSLSFVNVSKDKEGLKDWEKMQ